MSNTTRLGNSIIVTTGAGPFNQGERMCFVEVCLPGETGYHRTNIDQGNFDAIHANTLVEMMKPMAGNAEAYRQARRWLEDHGFAYRE